VAILLGLDAVLDYIWKNYEFTRDYLARELPSVQVIEPQGTYLLWVNCGPLGFSVSERKRRIYEEAGVFLEPECCRRDREHAIYTAFKSAGVQAHKLPRCGRRHPRCSESGAGSPQDWHRL